MFSPFVTNEADTIFPFSDGIFHNDCFRQHSLAKIVEFFYLRYRESNDVRNRKCLVCHEAINAPDGYVAFGCLTSDNSNLLSVYNFAHFHRSCLGRWPDLSNVIRILKDQLVSGAVKGKGIDWVFNTLKESTSDL